MNWYKKSQQNIIDDKNYSFTTRFKDRIPFSLKGLLSEALKYSTFEDFQNAYLRQIKHGRYWHVTHNPNFQIDPVLGPRDMSSMSTGKITPGKLMITSDLPYWAYEYNQGGDPRLYAAEIDMSNVPKDKYWQVNRGFGNEFWVDDPSLAMVIRVVPLKNALQIDKRYDKIKPQNFKELEELYYKIKENNLKNRK
jgi:hypothetical protein